MGGGSLTPDQSNRIAVAVEDIEQNVSRLRGYQDLSREEYYDDMVYDAVQNSLERYVRFLEAVDSYLDSVA